MENNTKLTSWVIHRIETEYKEDIALLIGIKGHSTDEDSHGECFDYFVPATEKGYELSETFIIDGIGHDLYPRSWERLENSVNLDDMVILIDQATILYARSKEDEDRFWDLKRRLSDNLQNSEFVYGKALECMDKALEIYRSMIFEEKIYRVRAEVNDIQEYLSKAIAFLNHTYTESAFYSANQTFHKEAESRMYHCPELQKIPEGFFPCANALIQAKDIDTLRENTYALLKMTRLFILSFGEKAIEKNHMAADFTELADWYQEMSLTWRRIRYFCKKNMAEEAYIDACRLQEELLYIAQEFQLEEQSLLDVFDMEDLDLLAARSNEVEEYIKDVLKKHLIPLKSYPSVDEFLQCYWSGTEQ